MNIIKTFPEQLSNKQLYDLTMSPKSKKMSSANGSILEVAAFARYIDTNKDGEARDVLSILTVDGEIFATNSPTFMDSFEKMCDLFGPQAVSAIEVFTDVSPKSGREYINCAYAGT